MQSSGDNSRRLSDERGSILLVRAVWSQGSRCVSIFKTSTQNETIIFQYHIRQQPLDSPKVGLFDGALCHLSLEAMIDMIIGLVLSRTFKGFDGDEGPWFCLPRQCRPKLALNCYLKGSFFSLFLKLERENTATSVWSPIYLCGCFFLANLAGTETACKSLSRKTLNCRLHVWWNSLFVNENNGFLL